MMLALIVATLNFTSCSSDDDGNDGINKKLIIGHWQSVTWRGYTIDKKTGEKTVYDDEPWKGLSFKLYEDGTCMYDSHMCSYKILGKELDIVGSFYVAGYDREGNSIQRLVDLSESYIIEELTSDKLVLSTSFNSTELENHTTYTMIKISN